MGKYDDRPYEVGKGKPPLHGRFGIRSQPARKGRPKGAKNADTIVREAFDFQVTVDLNGKSRKISKFAVGIEQLVNQAAKGDLRAIGMMIALKRELDSRADPAASRPLDDVDREFITDIAKELFPKTDDDQ